jgi:hypothetical protein
MRRDMGGAHEAQGRDVMEKAEKIEMGEWDERHLVLCVIHPRSFRSPM